MKKFSLVIPAYNEANNLPTVIQQTLNAAQTFHFSKDDFSLILVNNGSTDNSKAVIQEELRKNDWQKWVQVIDVVENKGYGHGLWRGLQAVDSEVVGWTHADLQCDPKNAFLAYQELRDKGANFDGSALLIKGHRYGRHWRDRAVTGIFELLAQCVLGLKIKEINAQPKVFPTQLLQQLADPPPDFAFDLYVLYCAQKNGHLIQSIPVLFPPRIHGVSRWAAHFTGRYKTIWSMIRYMFKLRRDDRAGKRKQV
jgi:glycosyltransferase involved in cell wall biosynthesis